MSRALIIIDFINEFLHPKGKITSQGMGEFCSKHGTIGNVASLVKEFRKNKEEVIWVHLGFHDSYDNCSSISPRFALTPSLGILKENSWSTDFIAELGYDPKEKTIIKTRISAFYKTDLDDYLRSKNIQELFITGVATDLAVSSITRDGHDRDFRITVISDACGTVSDDHHSAALIAIGKLGKIITTKELLSLI